MEDISGIWIDRRNGKKINVRDAIQDGDNLIIMTSEGSISCEIFQNYYIKMSEEDFGTSGLIPEIPKSQIMSVINQGLDKEDIIIPEKTLLDKPIETKSTETKSTETKSTETKLTETNNTDINRTMVKKVLDKRGLLIDIDFNVDKIIFPKSELEMLINVFDISIDDICSYIIEENFDNNKLSNMLKKYLSNILNLDKNNV